MSRDTAKQKSATGRFTQAMATGARILGGADVPAYTLTYLSNTLKHRQGDYETIVIPYIEIGRSKGCAVEFGDDNSTVSRRHAAIERQNPTTIVIKNLSQSNPTLVNGRPVKAEWYLTNGDIIQFAMEGPRVRFNISATGTAKMNFTSKAKLVAQQAIKPYRTAITILGIIFLASTAGLSYYLFQTKEEFGKYVVLNEEQKAQLGKTINDNENKAREAEKAHTKVVDNLKKQYTGKIKSLQSEIGNIKNTVVNSVSNNNSGVNQPVPVAMPDDVKNQVYFLRVKNIHVELGAKSDDMRGGWTGTGFLLSDGRFVTARHCIQGWRFIKSLDEKAMVILNLVENSGGRVTVDFEAVSSNGNTLSFQYDSKSRAGISLKDGADKTEDLGDGGQIKLATLNANDWTVVTDYNQSGGKSSVQTLPEFASHPKAQIEVHILGFSYGEDLQQRIPKPLYSKSMIAQDELTNGLINVTDRNFGPGNSGGPVYIYDTDTKTYKVIGIVSAGIGSEIGIIVPISQIR